MFDVTATLSGNAACVGAYDTTNPDAGLLRCKPLSRSFLSPGTTSSRSTVDFFRLDACDTPLLQRVPLVSQSFSVSLSPSPLPDPEVVADPATIPMSPMQLTEGVSTLIGAASSGLGFGDPTMILQLQALSFIGLSSCSSRAETKKNDVTRTFLSPLTLLLGDVDSVSSLGNLILLGAFGALHVLVLRHVLRKKLDGSVPSVEVVQKTLFRSHVKKFTPAKTTAMREGFATAWFPHLTIRVALFLLPGQFRFACAALFSPDIDHVALDVALGLICLTLAVGCTIALELLRQWAAGQRAVWFDVYRWGAAVRRSWWRRFLMPIGRWLPMEHARMISPYVGALSPQGSWTWLAPLLCTHAVAALSAIPGEEGAGCNVLYVLMSAVQLCLLIFTLFVRPHRVPVQIVFTTISLGLVSIAPLFHIGGGAGPNEQVQMAFSILLALTSVAQFVHGMWLRLIERPKTKSDANKAAESGSGVAIHEREEDEGSELALEPLSSSSSSSSSSDDGEGVRRRRRRSPPSPPASPPPRRVVTSSQLLSLEKLVNRICKQQRGSPLNSPQVGPSRPAAVVL